MAHLEEDPSFDLVARARRGDVDALDELMRRHLPGLRVYVRAHTGPALRRRETNSDLVQTVCREALQGLDQYQWQGVESFRYWLFSVALNKLRNKHDFHTAKKRDVLQEAEHDPEEFERLAETYKSICTPSQHAVARETVRNVEAALDRIDSDYRRVIVLSRIVGLKHREIGEEIGKSEGAVRVLLSRALTKLAGAMEAVERESRGERP